MEISWLRVVLISIGIAAIIFVISVRDVFIFTPEYDSDLYNAMIIPAATPQTIRSTYQGTLPPIAVEAEEIKPKRPSQNYKVLDGGVSENYRMTNNKTGIGDLVMIVPSGWENYIDGPDSVMMLSPDYQPPHLHHGSRIMVGYGVQDLSGLPNSSEEFVNTMLEKSAQAPMPADVFIKPHKITVGGVPMFHMGGITYDEGGGSVGVMGIHKGKVLFINVAFAGSYDSVKEVFEQFLSNIKFRE